MQNNEVDEFLSKLYLAKENDAIQLIYNKFYQLRQIKKYDVCDRILKDVDEKQLTPVLLVAFLTITSPMKKLLQRAEFFTRSKIRIASLYGDVKAKRILVGLEQLLV
jgi:hypothetical protein